MDFPSISHTRTYHCYVANILQRSLWSILILCQKVGRLFRFPSTHTCLSQLYFSVFLLPSFLRMFIFFRIVYFSSNDFLIFLNVCFRSNSYKSGLFHLFIYYLWIACRFLLRLVQVPKAKKTFRSNKVYDLVTDSNWVLKHKTNNIEIEKNISKKNCICDAIGIAMMQLAAVYWLEVDQWGAEIIIWILGELEHFYWYAFAEWLCSAWPTLFV